MTLDRKFARLTDLLREAQTDPKMSASYFCKLNEAQKLLNEINETLAALTKPQEKLF
jgi:hypothetical protein